MKNKKMARNGLIDMMRLVFALLITIYHFYSNGEEHFPGGRFGVEFFMILAGFLLLASWENRHISTLPIEERQSYWINYMKKRYSHFFCFTLAAFIAAFVIMRIWHQQIYDIAGICDNLSGDIWEAMLVKMNGLNKGTAMINTPTWTLSCMLFVEFFILGMLTFCKRPFLAFLMPLSVIFGTGYWMNLESIDIRLFHTFFTFGMLRVYLLMCFGIFSHQISQKIKLISFSKTGRSLLTVAELTGYTICLLICFFRDSRNYQFCFILIATFVVGISFSLKSFAGSILPANNFTSFCAEFSFSLYLIHYPILRIFKYTYEEVSDLYRQKFVFFFLVLSVTLIYMFFMRGVLKTLPVVKQKLKSVILEQT